MNNRRRFRTWPVFVVGIGSLLALLFLPGIVALRKTASVYREIQVIQDSHRRTQRVLSEVERRVYLISITVREALFDTSLSTTNKYKSDLADHMGQIEQQLETLRQQPLADSRVGLPKLE